MTITVPTDLRDRMRKHRVGWSHVASQAFERRLQAHETPRDEVHSLRYAREKLLGAMSTLRGPRSLQERLAAAHVYNLIYVPRYVLPDDELQRFGAMMKALTRAQPDGDEGRAVATAAQMSTDEAMEHAATIEHIAYVVSERLDELRI